MAHPVFWPCLWLLFCLSSQSHDSLLYNFNTLILNAKFPHCSAHLSVFPALNVPDLTDQLLTEMNWGLKSGKALKQNVEDRNRVGKHCTEPKPQKVTVQFVTDCTIVIELFSTTGQSQMIQSENKRKIKPFWDFSFKIIKVLHQFIDSRLVFSSPDFASATTPHHLNPFLVPGLIRRIAMLFFFLSVFWCFPGWTLACLLLLWICLY